MAAIFDVFPLVPRQGTTLQVLIMARISTAHQGERRLGDQAALCTKYVEDRYSGSVKFCVIQGHGGGELEDRRDLRDAKDAVASRAFDLLVVEDLGRICRRAYATVFVEMCQDAETRVVAIKDSIDTARDGWQRHTSP